MVGEQGAEAEGRLRRAATAAALLGDAAAAVGLAHLDSCWAALSDQHPARPVVHNPAPVPGGSACCH